MRPRRPTAVVSIGALGVLIVVGGWSCASRQPQVSRLVPNLQPRLDAADALVRVGCFECLTAALAEYDVLRTFAGAPPALADAAAVGAVRAALLLDMRERELGTTDDGYFVRAQKTLEALAARPEATDSFAPAIDLVDAVPWTGSAVRSTRGAEQAQRFQRLYQRRSVLKPVFLAKASAHEFLAYLWLTFACESGDARAMSGDDLIAPLGTLKDAPLIVYKSATCPRMDVKALADLLEREPRFVELNYFAGVDAILRGQLDEADQALQRAYRWRSTWPTVTQSLASVALTAEDFDRALRFYDETLALVPGHDAALLGRMQSLSYLGRHEEAIRASDTVLASGSQRGDAYYWRAWNEVQLNQLDQAWVDVQQSERLLVNAVVAKLAGMIAHRRQELEVARARFEQGYAMKSGDCEIGFYLGIVDAELRQWTAMAEVFVDTAGCVADDGRRLTEEIRKIAASDIAPERKARQIAKREEQIRHGVRLIATSRFNTAVAYFNLSRKTESRRYAEMVTDDQQFGDRARELLSRLEK